MLVERKKSDAMNPVDLALSWHDGDARATIETLLLDCEFLRQQLVLANGCISRGLTRGWVVSTERSA